MILNALGLKAVGLKRRLPLVSFLTWFLGKSVRSQHFRKPKPIHLIFLVASLFLLIYGNSKQWRPILALESAFLDFSAPLIGRLQQSFHFFAEIESFFRSHASLRQDLDSARRENNNLLKKNATLEQSLFLAREGQKVLSSLQEFSLGEKAFSVTTLNAPAVGQPLMIACPKNESMMAINSIIMVAKGLLGRVVLKGSRAAKVITLFDPTSRIPVDIQGVQGIAAGTGDSTLQLLHIKDAQHTLKKGDVVYTSGFGGIFPKGLPLGVISSIHNKKIEILPFESGQDSYHVVNVLPPVSDADVE